MSDINPRNEDLSKVASGVFHKKILFVNSYFVETPEKSADSFVLIDTGLPFSAGIIRGAIENRYGAGARPSAIVLTHGHFDHAGSALELSQKWDIPIYAHRLEMPYLTMYLQRPQQFKLQNKSEIILISIPISKVINKL